MKRRPIYPDIFRVLETAFLSDKRILWIQGLLSPVPLQVPKPEGEWSAFRVSFQAEEGPSNAADTRANFVSRFCRIRVTALSFKGFQYQNTR